MIPSRLSWTKIVLAFVSSLLLGISADSAPATGSFNICVVHNNADHPSITAIVKGINDEAAIYGFKGTFFDPAFDTAKQASKIEDCIGLKPSIIAVNVVDPAAVVSCLKKAKDPAIPVITH